MKRRPLRLAACLLVLLILIGIVVGPLISLTRRSEEVPLKLGQGEYAVRVVSEGAERVRGLSGTASLPKDKGMLFVFDRDGRWGIWMKDMNYPIDILWLDTSKKVVDMTERVSPSSYPSTTFRPKAPARYVLELAAGSVAGASIAMGDQATFNIQKPGGKKL